METLSRPKSEIINRIKPYSKKDLHNYLYELENSASIQNISPLTSENANTSKFLFFCNGIGFRKRKQYTRFNDLLHFCFT